MVLAHLRGAPSPLGCRYNGVLRGLDSGVDFLVCKMVELCCSTDVAAEYKDRTMAYEEVRPLVNRYTTTLHCINSAIVKLAKLTKATKVYRGVSGMGLPGDFWTANEFGVKGGIEAAFLSTTTDRKVAMQYAASSGVGFVFEIRQGMVNRGADIWWLSQYPHEREIL